MRTRPSAVRGGGTRTVGSRGPIVPTFRPFARRCCRTNRRRRSLWPCTETTPREALIRFMGVAARTEARKRRVNLVRQLLRRRDAVVAPSPVPRVSSSGTPAAGQLPLPDPSRPRRPRTRPRCAGGVPPTTASAPAHCAGRWSESAGWGAAAGTGRPPSMSILGRDRRPQGVDPGLACRHVIGRAARSRRPAGRQVRRVGERAGDGLERVVELGNHIGMTVSTCDDPALIIRPPPPQLRQITRYRVR